MSKASHEEYERGEENKLRAERRLACKECHAAGYKTIWQLITYVGPHSLSVKKKEDLPDIYNQEQANALQEKILNQGVETQAVLSAARRCGCAI